jgi:dihydrofolate reductase
VSETPVRIALVVAIAENGVIGREGDLPWRLSSDLKLFRRHTMGKPLIMGRKTFASLPGPLDGRDNIVVTRNKALAVEGATVVHSFQDALSRAEGFAHRRGADEICVIGGAEIFRQALPLAERVYLTQVDAHPPGDVFFPITDWSGWSTTFSECYVTGPKDTYPFTFSILERP